MQTAEDREDYIKQLESLNKSMTAQIIASTEKRKDLEQKLSISKSYGKDLEMVIKSLNEIIRSQNKEIKQLKKENLSLKVLKTKK